MPKSIKSEDNYYLDSSGIKHNRTSLDAILNKMGIKSDYKYVNIAPGESLDLPLPEGTFLIGIYFHARASNYSGGGFILPNDYFAYLTNTDSKADNASGNGTYVRYNEGALRTSSYNSNGIPITKVAWFYFDK